MFGVNRSLSLTFEQSVRNAAPTVHWMGRNWYFLLLYIRLTSLLMLWGSGLDYHYMNSPAEVQKAVLRRQLKHAVSLGKPITIHTREADEDIEGIMIDELPKAHKVCPSAHFLSPPSTLQIHVHCFTDSPELALRLLSHFPNLYIGITGGKSICSSVLNSH